MTVFGEERLRFEFGPSWHVLKYDDHAIYRDGIHNLKVDVACKHCGRLHGLASDAVDFVGVFRGQPYFIEVKDFRGHGVENRHRDVAAEVAFKVRDTVAGLVGACRHETWRSLVEPVFKRPPAVVLWLEEDAGPSRPGHGSHKKSHLKVLLQQRLTWLHPYGVMVMNQEKLRSDFDLGVRNLSDRVYNLRRLVGGHRANKRSLSRDDFGAAWSTAPQAAGEELKRLCDAGILARGPGAAECYVAGAAWDKLLDE